ncbi:MAG: glycosyltransferase family 39 protein [Kiritimatiellae bacterium]|nr:glycosyltransferase family 39 protein [Kiritimatiellia bacterium]
MLTVWLSVLAAAFLLLPDRLDNVRHNHDIGHADGVAYAWQARTLARGDGLQVPYITNFFHRYPQNFQRHDDQWGPLLSFVLAPVFRHHGPEANVARMTTVVISTLFLPLCFCMLVQALTGRAWTGLPAALPLLFSEALMQDGMELMNDQLLTALLCLFLAALAASRRVPALLLYCGPLIALAWYGKGSQIILIPFLAAGTALLHGPKFLLRREFLGALLFALVLMFPRLQANVRNFGRPLHSTQSYVSSFFGLSRGVWNHWDNGFYSIHWNQDPPGLRNRFDHPTLHQRSIRRNTEAILRGHLLGLDAETDDWSKLGPKTEYWATALLNRDQVHPLRNIAADVPEADPDTRLPWFSRLQILGLAWGAAATLISTGVWIFLRFRKNAPPGGGFADPATLVFCFVAVQAVFVILFWEAMLRLTFPAVIPALALPWTLLGVSIDALKRLRRRYLKIPTPAWAAPVLTLLFSMAILSNFHARAAALSLAQRQSLRRPPPDEPRYPALKALGERMAETLPADAILMCRNPWQTLWYAPETYRAIGLPNARPAELLAIAQHYGVTHLVLDRNRPGLPQFIRQNPEVFELVLRGRPPVYQIHYDKLPQGFLTPLHEIEPLWDARTGMRDEEEALRDRSNPEP